MELPKVFSCCIQNEPRAEARSRHSNSSWRFDFEVQQPGQLGDGIR